MFKLNYCANVQDINEKLSGLINKALWFPEIF